jgi:hypothetical protein
MTFLENPLQVVTPDVALAEIQQTNMLGEGRGLIAAMPVVEKKKVTLASATVNAEKSSTNNDNVAVDKVKENVETKAEENKSWSPF